MNAYTNWWGANKKFLGIPMSNIIICSFPLKSDEIILFRNKNNNIPTCFLGYCPHNLVFLSIATKLPFEPRIISLMLSQTPLTSKSVLKLESLSSGLDISVHFFYFSTTNFIDLLKFPEYTFTK